MRLPFLQEEWERFACTGANCGQKMSRFESALVCHCDTSVSWSVYPHE